MIKLYEVLGKPSTERMQHLLASGDLLKTLADNAVNLPEIDREAYKLLFTPKPKEINWTPVDQYGAKLRDWNDRFGLDLTDWQMNVAHNLPDHAGPHQPTGISLTLGKGLKGDRKIVQQIIKYELDKLGVPFDDELDNDARLSYFPGSEPMRSQTPQLAPALLDIGRFWDPQSGVVVRDVREQLWGQRLPALEVDWLMALNPQVFNAIDHETVPGFLAPGLVVGSDSLPCFDRDSEEAVVYDDGDTTWRFDDSVVVFQGVLGS